MVHGGGNRADVGEAKQPILSGFLNKIGQAGPKAAEMLGKLPISSFHPSGPSGTRHLIDRKHFEFATKIGVRSWPGAVSSGESGFMGCSDHATLLNFSKIFLSVNRFTLAGGVQRYFLDDQEHNN